MQSPSLDELLRAIEHDGGFTRAWFVPCTSRGMSTFEPLGGLFSDLSARAVTGAARRFGLGRVAVRNSALRCVKRITAVGLSGAMVPMAFLTIAGTFLFSLTMIMPTLFAGLLVGGVVLGASAIAWRWSPHAEAAASVVAVEPAHAHLTRLPAMTSDWSQKA